MFNLKMSEDELRTPTGDPGKDVSSEELFQIIDETGEGFGFDLTPSSLAKPMLVGSATLFGIGMLAGVPLGIAMGRAEETGKKLKGSARVQPSLSGVKFAAASLGLGTLLCATLGVATFHTMKWYYQVETFEQFGNIMRETVPARRANMEKSLSPVLNTVRQSAGDNLPAPMLRFRERFENSRFGRWVKSQVDASITITNDKGNSNGAGSH